MIGVIFIIYLFILLSAYMIYALLLEDNSDWKYSNIQPLLVVFYPLLTVFLLRDLVIYINNRLTKNNLKQMNLKILMKAMSFMFLPTLGVLLMLLVGFFDPIMLWTWIKSPSGWAVFTRILLFILEIGLIALMYFHYLEEYNKEEYLKGCDDVKINRTNMRSASRLDTLLEMFPSDRGDYKYFKTPTENPNIVLIERKEK